MGDHWVNQWKAERGSDWRMRNERACSHCLAQTEESDVEVLELRTYHQQREAGPIRWPFKASEWGAISLCWAPSIRSLEKDVWILSLKCWLLFPICRRVNWKGQDCARRGELPAVGRLPPAPGNADEKIEHKDEQTSGEHVQAVKILTQYQDIWKHSWNTLWVMGAVYYMVNAYSTKVISHVRPRESEKLALHQGAWFSKMLPAQRLCCCAPAFKHRERGSNQHEEKTGDPLQLCAWQCFNSVSINSSVQNMR